jgi:hypothetical protein
MAGDQQARTPTNTLEPITLEHAPESATLHGNLLNQIS